tara:strand:- start:626 stop:1168 length:543 start_codon:yes stop_codon:yes gene_type:complete
MKNIYVLLLVLILLSTLNGIRNNPLLKNILGFVLITVLLMKLKLNKKSIHLLLTSLGILLGLIILEKMLTRNQFELFEDKDEETDDEEDNDKENDKEKKEKLTVEEMIDELDKIKKEDINDDDKGDKTETKNLAELKPYQAQRETYQLIETVKNLKDTMNTLGPTLKEAKSILNTYKQFS